MAMRVLFGRASVPSQPQNQPADAGAKQAHATGRARRGGGGFRHLAPWAISLVFHISIAVALMFALMLAVDDDSIVVPNARLAEFPGSPLDASEMRPDVQPLTDPTMTMDVQVPPNAEPVLEDVDDSEEDLIIAADGEAALGELSFDVDLSAEVSTPRSEFFGTGGTARHIVYVVDCSGSMDNALGTAASPGPVRWELVRSVSQLQPSQRFQLIFFTTGEPRRFPQGGLIAATDDAKRQAARFMKAIRPDISTDPIPALSRAFEALNRIQAAAGEKLIYLLTDGFELDSDNVLSTLKRLNRRGDVRICVVLYDELPAAARGDSWLRRIAEQHGGQFQRIIAEE